MSNEVATVEQPLLSRSGKYRLTVVQTEVAGQQMQYFQIVDAGGDVLFACAERFSVRDMTYMLWDPQDRVWVYSGDVGTYFWEQTSDPTQWQIHTYATSDVPAPQYLKEKRPRWITR